MTPGRILSWCFWFASWACFLSGLLLSEKVVVKSTDQDTPQPADFALTSAGRHEFRYSTEGKGSQSLSVSIRTRVDTDYDMRLIQEWAKRGATVSWSIRVKDDSGKSEEIWSVSRDAVHLIKGGTSERLLLGQKDWSVPEGFNGVLIVELVGDDRFFFEHEPRLHLGPLDGPGLSKSTRNILSGRGRNPGLILLLGSSGVFVHLFFFVARLLVPWRTECISSDEEMI